MPKCRKINSRREDPKALLSRVMGFIEEKKQRGEYDPDSNFIMPNWWIEWAAEKLANIKEP